MKHDVSRALALLLALCLALPVAALAESLDFSLIAYPEKTDRATNAVGFSGVAGESYALWQGFEGTWQETPQTVTLTLEQNQGAFTVECVPGMNDFVLTRADAQGPTEPESIVFQILYTQPEATEAPTASPEPTAAATPAPNITVTVQPSATPEATTEPEPTAEPEAESTAEPEPTEAPQPEQRTLKLWSRGDDVLALQQGLTALGYKVGRQDGVYGPKTRAAVMRYQRARDLTRDGMVGEETRQALAAEGVEIPAYVAPDDTMPEGFERVLQRGMAGMDVRAMQEALKERGYLQGRADHIFGKKTRAALRAFQRDNGLPDDGVAGPQTLRLLMDGLDIQVEPTAEPTAEPAPEMTEAPAPEATEAPAPEETQAAEHPNG